MTTLTFDYPNTPNRDERQATFRKNLEDLLVWTHDQQIDPTTVLGSYTGAIGIPQFLPSSIVQYAVDFDGNGHIDLRTSTADAIGSVANYLKQHGWESGRPVVWKIAGDVGSQGIAQAAADGQPEPHWSLAQLTKAGMLMGEPGVNSGGSRHAGDGGGFTDTGPGNRVHAGAEELLRADPLQPQLLLCARRVSAW